VLELNEEAFKLANGSCPQAVLVFVIGITFDGVEEATSHSTMTTACLPEICYALPAQSVVPDRCIKGASLRRLQ
jgi:hypothetical protein